MNVQTKILFLASLFKYEGVTQSFLDREQVKKFMDSKWSSTSGMVGFYVELVKT